MRTVIGAVCIVCVATVLTEALGVAYLAVRGRLSRQAMQDVSDVLAGRDIRRPDVEQEQTAGVPDSTDDVINKRVARVWEIQRREREWAIIQDLVDRRVAQVTNEQKQLDDAKQAFAARLQQTSDALNAESAEQARGILVKLDPANAVQNLMALDLGQNVVLMKGLDERAFASLLQEFMTSQDPKTQERGRKIFEAVAEGQPKRKILTGNANRLSPFPTPPPGKQP